MDIIDQLIKSLEDAKAELSKNMNCAPGSNSNMSKEEMDKAASKAPQSSPVVGIPAEHVKAVKIKNLQRQIEGGTYKPDAGKIADKMINPDHPPSLSHRDVKKLVKEEQEEMQMSENGQWNLKTQD